MRSSNLVLITLVYASQAHGGHELEGRDVPAGAQLYVEHCASCHGAELEGEPDWQTPNSDGSMPAPPHDETGHTWHHDNQLLFDYTRIGGQAVLSALGIDDVKSGMPGFSEVLTDEEIWNVLAYIRSTWPDRIQEVQAMRNPPHQ